MDRRADVGRTAARALTKREIDRRIQQLTSNLAGGSEGEKGDSCSPDAVHPRWIEPSELVRRLRQFVVYN